MVFGATSATLINPPTASVRRIKLRIGKYLPLISVRIFFMYEIISYRKIFIRGVHSNNADLFALLMN